MLCMIFQMVIVTTCVVLTQAEKIQNVPSFGRVSLDLDGFNNSNISYSGVVPIVNHTNCSIFFWFYQSFQDAQDNLIANNSKMMNKSIPFILWLQGGPGTSDFLGNFFEFGPYHISTNNNNNNDNYKFEFNKYTWVSQAHILFIDQPIGTGLSQVGNDLDLITNLSQGASMLYQMLDVFFNDIMNGIYKDNPFYIFGESFGGHYVPFYTDYILQHENKLANKLLPAINGIAVGNGWNVPCIIVPYSIPMAESLGIIDLNSQTFLKDELKNFTQLLDYYCNMMNSSNDYYDASFNAFAQTGFIFGSILTQSGDMNKYDSRYHYYPSYLYDYTILESFLNNDTVRGKLYVDYSRQEWQFGMDSGPVNKALVFEQMLDLRPYYSNILDKYGLKVLIYQGQNDPFLVTQGQLAWLDQMKWSGQKYWLDSEQIAWKMYDTDANMKIPVGFVRKPQLNDVAQQLIWIEIFNAGHMSPANQPQVALQMMYNFIYNKPFE